MAESNKQLSREDCPEILDALVNLISEQIQVLRNKSELNSEDHRNIISMGVFISNIYERYTEEVRLLEKDLKSFSKADLVRITKSETKIRTKKEKK